MAVERWHFPSATGDFELAPVEGEDPAKSCQLIVEDPTDAEKPKLLKAIREYRSKGWLDELAGINPTGRTELVIGASIAECGPILAGEAMPDRGVLTAVRSTDGVMLVVVTGDEPNALAKVGKAVQDAKADTAVTTRRFTKCCPNPVEGPLVRSSKVLKTFCTRQQWQTWMERGYLFAYGHLSGHPYRISHRHHPYSIEQGYVCRDMLVNQVVHGYDWSVPPAEEVLGFKLAIEHSEQWVRCPASGFGPTVGHLGGDNIGFVDPTDNDIQEGLWDAAVLTGIGGVVEGAIVGASISRAVLTGNTSGLSDPSVQRQLRHWERGMCALLGLG
jgi:hypothetical protein